MERLYDYINNKEWIKNRIVYYFNKDGYNKSYLKNNFNYDSYIESISKSIIDFSKKGSHTVNFKGEKIYEIVYAIINNLVKCRDNIDCGSLIGILKCCRKAYIDLILQGDFQAEYKLEFANYIERYFDKLEIATCSEWTKISDDKTKFNTLAEISSVFVFMCSKVGYLYVNPAIEELLGYTRDEIYNMDKFKIVHEDYRNEIVWDELENTEDNEKNMVNTRKCELKLISKDGQEKWIECNYATVNFAGNYVMLGMGFDIGERKKVEEALRESENRYRKLVELMPDAVYVHSNDKIVYANKAGAKLMGYSDPGQILGKASCDILEIDDYYKTLIKQQDDIIMRSGYLSPVERKYFRKTDGKFLEVETTSTVISYEKDKAILNITRDISERKRIEFLKQKVRQKTLLLNQTIEYNKLRTEFFANISHELRTPLNMILGSIQLVNAIPNDKQGINTDNKVKKYMAIIKQNSYRLVRLVDNLIDITKIDAGYLDINLQNEDIVKVVEDISLSVVEYVESKGLELIFDTDIEEKTMAFDEDKIERIMLNLISNAIKFTKPGGKIYVNIYDKKDKVVIAVRDTGIGIPLEKHKEVFERFIQVDKSLSRKREGSGIGLSLVKSLVEMHEGIIYINKENTEGTEFIIELPAKLLNTIKEANESNNVAQNYIERIKVEFSDIYS